MAVHVIYYGSKISQNKAATGRDTAKAGLAVVRDPR
jgi:hypothetical protein